MFIMISEPRGSFCSGRRIIVGCPQSVFDSLIVDIVYGLNIISSGQPNLGGYLVGHDIAIKLQWRRKSD